MGRLYNKKLISGLFLFAIMASFSHGADITFGYIGQRIIPHEYNYEGTMVGGLSGLDYDPKTESYVAVSDDRSKENPARFYGLKLDYDISGFHGWKVADVHFIKGIDGAVFPKADFFGKSYVDPESLKISPSGNSYFWTSEGHAKHGVNPFVREMALDGSYLRDFTLPKKYLVTDNKGIRDNLAFEALTVTTDNKSLVISTEGPLKQDGQEADAGHGALVRLLQFDIETGQAIHEYVYSLEPVHKEPLPVGNFSVNGVVDILALNSNEYIIAERSFSFGVGLSVRLYLVNLAGATDVLSLESLQGSQYQIADKKLLLDLGELGITIDNIEGMSFGKMLKDGRRSLIMISDDNFSFAQVTQILAFAVNGLN